MERLHSRLTQLLNILAHTAIALGLSLSFAHRAFAVDAKPTPATSPTPTLARPYMQRLLAELIPVWTAAESEREFSNAKNRVEILGHLKKMEALMKDARHTGSFKSPGLDLSSEIFVEQFKAIRQSFEAGNARYARWMLNSNLSVCVSCHMQVDSQSSLKWQIPEVDAKHPLTKANLLFLTRRFDEALPLYKEHIKKYSEKTGGRFDELQNSIQRVMSILVRIHRDPKETEAFLKDTLKNKHIPRLMLADLNDWSKQVKVWKGEKIPAVEKMSDVDLRNFAEKHLNQELEDDGPISDPAHSVTYLYVSGILYDALQKKPEGAMTPEILYWLAVCDRGLNHEFFYSLADTYLKQCMTQYSKNPVAKKCYGEYERNLYYSYTGSSGVNVPPEAKTELKKYAELTGAKPRPEPKASHDDDEEGDDD